MLTFERPTGLQNVDKETKTSTLFQRFHVLLPRTMKSWVT